MLACKSRDAKQMFASFMEDELMAPIRLISNKADLRGTCYFEFLPGEYKEECWNDESVFLAEETFALIEPIIARHEPRFDHYSFIGIRRPVWEGIIADLTHLASRVDGATNVDDLRDSVGFFFTTSEREFGENLKSNAHDLAKMIRELVAWLRVQLKSHESVSVLGM
jgi:hypothetical protein